MKVAGELGRAAFAAVDMGVDCLVADGHRLSFAAQPSCDLFRRPPGLQSIENGGLHLREPDELARHLAATFCHRLRVQPVVSVQLGSSASRKKFRRISR